MTPDLSLLSGFARGVLLSLHVRDTCLHSGSWLLSGFFLMLSLNPKPSLGSLGVIQITCAYCWQAPSRPEVRSSCPEKDVSFSLNSLKGII